MQIRNPMRHPELAAGALAFGLPWHETQQTSDRFTLNGTATRERVPCSCCRLRWLRLCSGTRHPLKRRWILHYSHSSTSNWSDNREYRNPTHLHSYHRYGRHWPLIATPGPESAILVPRFRKHKFFFGRPLQRAKKSIFDFYHPKFTPHNGGDSDWKPDPFEFLKGTGESFLQKKNRTTKGTHSCLERYHEKGYA